MQDKRVKEILKKHNLDFSIIKMPLSGKLEDKEILTPYYGLYNSKTGETINTCKEGYAVTQNADIVDMVLRGTEKYGSQLNVEFAGSINGGKRVYIQLSIDGVGKVGDDVVKKYITLIDSNDGSTGLGISVGDDCMRCENQFFRMYRKSQSKFRHTTSINKKILEIPKLIESALGDSIKQIETYNKFLSTKVSRDLAHKLVREVLGYDRTMSQTELDAMKGRSVKMMDNLYADIDTEFSEVGQNMWGLFGGVTRYTTHHISGPDRDNGKKETLLVGNGYKKNQIAFEFAAKHSGIVLV